MIPGMNPREMKAAMKRLGIKQEEIEAHEVIIRCPDKELIIQNPQVAKIDMMGNETFQISGDVVEREVSSAADINSDDIQTVMDQTGASEQEAKEAIERNEGDLAQAILDLKK
jgi:nascent polypeptide-associated complex subunit alpha